MIKVLLLVGSCLHVRGFVLPSSLNPAVKARSTTAGRIHTRLSASQLAAVPATDTAIIWYTPCDLRVHDHEGLAAAAGAGAVVPVFVFDPKVLQAEGPVMSEYMYHAVSDLRTSLMEMGSNLLIRVGDAPTELQKLIQDTTASCVIVHDSPLTALQTQLIEVKAALKSSNVPIKKWRTSVYASSSKESSQVEVEEKSQSSAVWSYDEYRKSLGSSGECKPVRVPQELPSLEVAATDMPALEDIINISCAGILESAARTAPPIFGTSTMCKPGFGEKRILELLDEYVQLGEGPFGEKIFKDEVQGASAGLEAAAITRVMRAKGVSGLAPGEVFSRVFGPAISLGCLSLRRANVARQLGYAPNIITVQRPSTCWARDMVRSVDWHDTLARSGRSQEPLAMNGLGERKWWRYNGHLCRYSEGGKLDDPSAPILVMVHGFGASLDQWERLGNELKDTHKLYAVDLIGFGWSQKPPLTYTQYMWSDIVRDFGLQIIRKPFFVAGNSIGGYTAMGVAADTEGLCKGVILCNSAGRLLSPEDYSAELQRFGGSAADATLTHTLPIKYSAPPNLMLSVISTALYLGLQNQIKTICKKVYPTRPERVDELSVNILRDSKDPGAIGIFNAGAKLPFSRSANEMLQKFGGPVLVAQGLLDPLNDARGRANQFKDVHTDVEVVGVEGGHCPQEEMAEEIAPLISDFIQRKSSKKEPVQHATPKPVREVPVMIPGAVVAAA